ncbi:MAG: ABC transporter substrate-binding protein [Chitinophagales bacterium]|nr:ABC transporter substrate-binding protein [Chitinophagales bacterium]
MLSFTDQTGQVVRLPAIPKRIISLVPSQTELLADLGLTDEVVGITKFCIHPKEWFHSKIRVGGTKQLNTAIIHSLAPDLVIANKEENVKEQINELQQQYPVWISDVNNLDDAYEMIAQIGAMTEKSEQATRIIEKISTKFSQLQTSNFKLKTAYLIWQKPYMTVGGDTFIHSMLELAGFDNICKEQTRYPEVTIAELKNANCELLLLSSEPFPFQQKHIDELQSLLPNTKIILVDGELFSWYGSRLLKAPAYFTALQKQLA